MAVYGYIRVSTDRQASEGESLDVQRRQIEGWCLMHGEALGCPAFQDEGVSGSTPLAERPAGRELLAALKPGDVVVAAKLDRMFRNALDALQTVERLKAKKIKLWLLDLGEVAGNGMAKAFLTMASAFAELERDMIRERVSNTKRDQRQRGRYLGGKPPFGFAVDWQMIDGRRQAVLTLVKLEQDIIRQAIGLRQQGRTYRDVQEEVERQFSRRVSLATLKRICDEPGSLEAEQQLARLAERADSVLLPA